MSKPSVTVFIGRLDLSGGRTVMLFKTVDILIDAGFEPNAWRLSKPIAEQLRLTPSYFQTLGILLKQRFWKTYQVWSSRS